MPFNTSIILDGSAALLNDVAKTAFTYAAQLPYFKMAYDELRMELEDNNIPISNLSSAAITVAAAATTIGDTTGAALPTDLVEILELWERPLGTSGDYFLMERKQFLPKVSGTVSYFGVYSYNNQIIYLLPASAAIEVKIDYVGDPLAAIVDENTSIRVLNCANFLKYRNAGLCAEFIGENPTRAASLNQNAERSLQILLNIGIKTTQSIPTRRRGFRRRTSMGLI